MTKNGKQCHLHQKKNIILSENRQPLFWPHFFWYLRHVYVTNVRHRYCLTNNYLKNYKTLSFNKTFHAKAVPANWSPIDCWKQRPRCMPFNVQKQLPQMFDKKRCSLKYGKIHKKTPVSESCFWLGCRPQACHFLKKETPTLVCFCGFCKKFSGHLFCRTWLLLNADASVYHFLQ